MKSLILVTAFLFSPFSHAEFNSGCNQFLDPIDSEQAFGFVIKGDDAEEIYHALSEYSEELIDEGGGAGGTYYLNLDFVKAYRRDYRDITYEINFLSSTKADIKRVAEMLFGYDISPDNAFNTKTLRIAIHRAPLRKPEKRSLWDRVFN